MTEVLEYGWLGVMALFLGASCVTIAVLRFIAWWRDRV